jgi:hypothetical protein
MLILLAIGLLAVAAVMSFYVLFIHFGKEWNSK